MRVIAGRFRGRQLRSLRGLDIRPTSDRLRETLFDVLTAGNPQALKGSVWVDLFAGTGAVGIEALSREASKVYFVERSKRAAEMIRTNIAILSVASGAYEVVTQESVRAVKALALRAIGPDYIFLDPPYAMRGLYTETLSALGDSSLAVRALVIVEHEKKFDPGSRFGPLQRSRRLEQGDAALSFYRRV
jgi:16S rRNA (guanine966-N2)-methyltransferase